MSYLDQLLFAEVDTENEHLQLELARSTSRNEREPRDPYHFDCTLRQSALTEMFENLSSSRSREIGT